MDGTIVDLIEAAEEGRANASAQLFAALYDELHRLAKHQLRRGGAELTLGATTLLHEAYLDMARREGVRFPDRARFMGYAARAMRGLVIDYVRRRGAIKRGRRLEITLDTEAATLARGGELQITLVGPETATDEALRQAAELERLGDALDELADIEPALAGLVDLHFFCGFTFAEIADFRGISERTVQRDWRKARLLLHHALLDGGSAAAPEA